MEAMINQNPFGAHGDIMGASPEDDQGKATLCEEIKNRARYDSIPALLRLSVPYALQQGWGCGATDRWAI